MKKRALSNIIATLMLVLLSLGAVVIVWNFVLPMIRESGVNLELQTKCVDIFIEPISCTFVYNTTNNSYDLTILTKNSKGDAVGVSQIIEFEDKSIKVFNSLAPSLLATKTQTINNILKNPAKFKVAAVVTNEQKTKNFTCAETPAEVKCTYPCASISGCSSYTSEFLCNNDPCKIKNCQFNGTNCL